MDWQAIYLTLKLATIVCLLLAAIGTPIALWLAFTQWRWKALVEAVVALPLVLPPTVLGFYLLVAFGAQSWAGRVFEGVTGHTLAFSFPGLVVASMLYSLPFAVQPMAAAFAGVDRKLLQAAEMLGAPRGRIMREVVLPLCAPGVLAGMVLSFAHTVGEFGVVLMVGGNIPGVTRTISIAIFDKVQELDHRSAQQTSLLLLAFSFLVLVAVYSLNRRHWRRWMLQEERS